MIDLTTKLLDGIRNHHSPNLDLPKPLVLPQYQGGSILNVPASICEIFGIPSFGAQAFIPEIMSPLKEVASNPKRVILVLVDALALHRFQKWFEKDDHGVWEGFHDQSLLAPITSVFPSTTSTALPTIWSGLSPAQHGMVGYELWLQEYGVVTNMITHAPMYIPGDPGRLDLAGFDPEKVLPGVVLGEHFSSQGIEAHSFQYYNIIRSGLSRMFLKNTTIHPYGSDTELWINLRKLVESKAEQKLFVGIYWGRVDSLSHLYGPDDERPAAEFAHFMAEFSSVFINKLDPKIRKDTLFLLIADHGQITTPKQPHYDLKNHPDLLRRLHIRPTGENRAAYFYIKPGQFEAVREYLDRKFLGQFIQMDPVYAAQHGLFGPGGHHSRLLERTGDLMTIAKDAAYLWWSDKENPLLGRHGGLHEEEMIVPFFAAAL